jgi:hypothetical protein
MQMVLVCRIDFVRLFCSDRLLKEESRHSCEGELVIETLSVYFPTEHQDSNRVYCFVG